MGGKFCLSDDSHGVEQVALNYHQLLPFLQHTGIKELHFLNHTQENSSKVARKEFPQCMVGAISLEELNNHEFWPR